MGCRFWPDDGLIVYLGAEDTVCGRIALCDILGSFGSLLADPLFS